MLRRALQIGLALYLVMGVGELLPAIADTIAGAHEDCCLECDDPGCPEQDGQECPPQCDDCVCPCWVPIAVAAPSSALVSAAPQPVLYITGDVTHEPPVLRGVFRPPRLSA